MTEGKKIEVDPDLMKILARNPEGFMRRYEEHLKSFRYFNQAYEATEAEHEALCGSRRYSDISTFKVVRSRMFKRR